MPNKVILVDKDNNEIGIESKTKVHTANTPLHRGLSVFLFNKKGQLLIQQRALTKLTFPGIWSNSCCGHPQPGEENIEAAKRHVKHELGIQTTDIHLVLPDFRYTAEMNGVEENEICPVFVAFSDKKPDPNLSEVESIKWIGWDEFLEQIKSNAGYYSKWSKEEALLLEKSPEFNQYRSLKTTNIV